MDQKTPLYEAHIRHFGKMVGFAGYLLPVQYTSIIAEHNAVRQKCGLFDVSHMGEFKLTGQDALASLNAILTNDFTSLAAGKARYSPMCYAEGGTVDDLLVYRTGEQCYMLVVNASNRLKDFEHIQKHLVPHTELTDISDETALLALQGPLALELIRPFCEQLPEANYSFVETKVSGFDAILSRTGYTGEDGFEIYCGNDAAPIIFEKLLQSGAVPCGLGARDTLRLEASMPLYGHELSSDITPPEAGLSRFVRTEKNFIGRDALLMPQKRKLIGIVLNDKGIARQGDSVYSENKLIGTVTSGTLAPTLGKPICMALADIDADLGCLSVESRGRRLAAVQTPLPFYRRAK